MIRFLPAIILVVAGVLSIGASCQKIPTTAATSADGDLCAHLAAVGCATGSDPSCPLALAKLRTIEPVPSACLLDATTKLSVVACGWECP